jgi:spore coat polysaccharide biosynthesis protein SpsF
MKTVVIIQARMGSTRLSGKVMKNLYGKSVLEHDIERVKQCNQIDDIIIATTDHENDTVIAMEAEKCGVKCFRGSESDVLSRYYFAAKENNADIVVRITSDCPLIDPFVTDQVIDFYKTHDYHYVSNGNTDPSKVTYPRGLDTEVFSFKGLEEAYLNAKESYQREHVTPYFYEDGKNVYFYKNNKDYSKYRWTLDTDSDWELIQQIYKHLYKGTHDFYMEDVVKLMEETPELYEINKDIKQKHYK